MRRFRPTTIQDETGIATTTTGITTANKKIRTSSSSSSVQTIMFVVLLVLTIVFGTLLLQTESINERSAGEEKNGGDGEGGGIGIGIGRGGRRTHDHKQFLDEFIQPQLSKKSNVNNNNNNNNNNNKLLIKSNWKLVGAQHTNPNKEAIVDVDSQSNFNQSNPDSWPKYLTNSPLAKRPRYKDIDLMILYESTVFGAKPQNSFMRGEFKTYICNISTEKEIKYTPPASSSSSPSMKFKQTPFLYNNFKVLLTDDHSLSEYAHGFIHHGPDIGRGHSFNDKYKNNDKKIRIYHTMESPAATSISLTSESITKYFHLLMSYHFKSDIFLPYIGLGTLRLLVDKPILVSFQDKNPDYPLAWIGSNCNAHNGRQDYLRELFKHIPTHSYGGCLRTQSHAVNRGGDAMAKTISQYKFYIVMENSNCEDYITEKLGSAIISSTIPIVFSINGSLPNYNKYMPIHSYINAYDFSSAQELANYLLQVSKNETLYNSYLWYKFEAMKSITRKEQIWNDILTKYEYKETKNHWCRTANSIFHYLYHNSNQTLEPDQSCQPRQIMSRFIDTHTNKKQ